MSTVSSTTGGMSTVRARFLADGASSCVGLDVSKRADSALSNDDIGSVALAIDAATSSGADNIGDDKMRDAPPPPQLMTFGIISAVDVAINDFDVGVSW